MAISRRSRGTLIAGHVQAQSGRTIHVDDGQAWGWSRERGRERRNATYAGGPAGGRVRHSVGWVIGGKVRPVQKDSTVGFSSSFPTDPLPAGRLQEAPTVQHMTSDSQHQPMPREGMGAWLVFAASCSLLLFIESAPTDWAVVSVGIVRRTTDIGSPFVPGMYPGTPAVSGV